MIVEQIEKTVEIENIVEISPKYTNGTDTSNFQQSALAKFGNIMRWREGQTLQSWSENLLEQLIPFVGGFQGVLYYTDTHAKELLYSSGFAIDFVEAIKKKYVFGEGLIGQVAKNQEIMILSDKDDFVSLGSVLKFRLKCIIILPLIYNDRTTGVIEINFPQNPQEQHLNFLKFISDSIASNLNALVKEQELAQSFKKIRASEERLQRLAEVTSEGVAFLDDAGNILECNGAFLKIFGYNESELKGKKFVDLLQEEEAIQEFEDQIIGDIPYETLGIRKDDTNLDIEIQERDIDTYSEFGYIVSVRDISKRKKAEAELEVKEAELKEAQKIVELSEIIKAKSMSITSSIKYAKRILNALLPEVQEIGKEFPESFIFYRPKDVVSGDFYWFTKEADKIIIGAIDCTGHGVPGSIMSMAGSVFLGQIVNLQEITAPDEILTRLHFNISKALKQDESGNRDGMDAALCTIDRHTGTLTFAGAKNSLVYFQDEQMYELKGDNAPIGGFWGKNEKTRIFKSQSIEIDKPTTCYLFSDGYEDQFGGPEGRKFMKRQFRNLLQEIYQKPMQEQLQILNETMDNWQKSQRQIDDMLIVGFTI